MNYRTFCLCLPEYPDQIEAAKKHFEEMEVGPVEFFWGIHAEIAGLATAHVYERDAPGSGFKMGYKPTGIWLSHYMLWSAVMRSNDEHILILETDAKFLPGWKEKLEASFKVLPANWDFLHIGHCCMEGFPRKFIGADTWNSKFAQCTHAYMVRRACLPFVLKTLRKCYGPIDIQMQLECFPHLNCFAIMPRIVDQFNTILPP